MPWGTRAALFVLMFSFLLSQVGRLAGLGALLHRETRRDVAAWLLAGMGIAGWGAAFLISHVANGEVYFAYSAVPAEAALTAWLLAAAAPARRRVLVVPGGIALGWLTGALLYRVGPGRRYLDGTVVTGGNPGGGRELWVAHWRYDLLVPVAALAAVVRPGCCSGGCCACGGGPPWSEPAPRCWSRARSGSASTTRTATCGLR
jgi:hypothetical protein